MNIYFIIANNTDCIRKMQTFFNIERMTVMSEKQNNQKNNRNQNSSQKENQSNKNKQNEQNSGNNKL